MGYCFDYRHRLCCDGCGIAGGVRKRKCAYKVGPVPYCSPPALCGPCYKKHGGLRGVHGEACREGAEKAIARDAADKLRREAGDLRLVSAVGSWGKGVPKGKVRLTFDGGVCVIVPEDDYEYDRVRWFLDLSNYELVAE